MTKITKRYCLLSWVFTIISILCNIAPLAAYSIKAIMETNLTHEKVTLTMTVFVVLLMTLISFINKSAMRSRLWVVLIGIYVCLDYIMTPLIIIACCQIADELIVCPLKNSFKNKYQINKQIDKRGV